MQHSFTLLAAFVLSSNLLAQPTLTFTNNAPQPGASYTLRYGAYLEPGSAGAAQTWDLSGFITDSTEAITMVVPSTVPGHETFPGATVTETGNTATMYFRAANDGMYLVGSDAGEAVIPYSDQGRYLPYPCTYLTEWTDDATATFTVEGVDVERNGTIEGEADGYGTLILPTGEVENVLRIHWLETTVDHTDLFEITSVYDSYIYYSAVGRFPLVQIVSAEVNVLGNVVTTEFTQWYDGLITGTDDLRPETASLQAWPNPARDLVQVQLPHELGREVFVQFQDAAGRAVHSMRAVASTDGRIQLALDGVPIGLYLLTATDVDGRQASVRLSVH